MATAAMDQRWTNHLKQFTAMKKIFIALAAVAAMVGCSKENAPIDAIEKDSFTMNASIVLDETRVTVGGDKFNEVSWVEGDKIRVESEAGFNADMQATSSGRDNIRFVGTEYPAAEVDTYYAVYPSSNISNATVTFYCDNQSGNDVAVLVAKAEGVDSTDPKMEFRPVNSLLHVAVNGVESLSKAEFKSYTGKTLAADFTYNYADDTIEYGTATVASYEVETPSADGFFFSLPADLDMSEGYVVTLTDANGNVCSKAYNGKTFAKATTTRVAIEWSTPSVTLGAKTSYSYYLLNQPASANTCANNVIYFTGDCATTYAGIQNVYVTEVGFKVDGTTYSSANGSVTWNKSAKSFSMNNMTVSEKRGYAVEAYIVTKEHGTITSSNTLYITGLPYTLNVSANDGTWAEEGNVNWNTSSGIRLGYYQLSGEAYIQKSDFVLPANVNIQLVGSGKVNGTGSWIKVDNTASYIVSGNTLFSKTAKGNAPQSYNINATGTMSASDPSVKINSSYNLEKAYVLTYSLNINYSNK